MPTIYCRDSIIPQTYFYVILYCFCHDINEMQVACRALKRLPLIAQLQEVHSRYHSIRSIYRNI